ncbi:MAG: type II toxin-antitoxin system prevent-host-death family antitoxin [Thermomonas sp.]|uniref:type II toxin-antitoxin system Phd/YefM family antitoxin n=1 Tax=Thermomonas sp. TaxID=1971895 RepID=UPI0039E3B097
MQVNILEAKTRLSELVKLAQAGEEVVIANRGAPVVKLVKVAPVSKDADIGNGKRIVQWLIDNPLPAYMKRRTDAEIDAYIAEERDSWD